MKFLILISLFSISINAEAQKKKKEITFRGFKAYLTATFLNRNVYKTKGILPVKKVYYKGNPTADARDFALVPNPAYPSVTQTTVVVKTTPAVPAILAVPAGLGGNPPAVVGVAAVPSKTVTTTTVTTIPPTNTVITETIVSPVVPDPTATITTTTTRSSVPPNPAAGNKAYIRYKVVNDVGDYVYIKVLPGCIFTGTAPLDTSVVVDNGNTTVSDYPKDYVFLVAKKALTPNTNYLASSALIGKVTSIPVRFRNNYWDDNNKVLQGNFSIGYAFGWKYKLGNNPYHSSYISTIIYGAGVSAQKYFSIAGKYANGKDSLSAKTDEFALTYLSFGVTYEFEKFNIGIFFGKDKMFGNLKDWVYQDKWWWGIGIGYELFK